MKIKKKTLFGWVCFVNNKPVIFENYNTIEDREYEHIKFFNKRKDAKQYTDDVRKITIGIK